MTIRRFSPFSNAQLSNAFPSLSSCPIFTLKTLQCPLIAFVFSSSRYHSFDTSAQASSLKILQLECSKQSTSLLEIFYSKMKRLFPTAQLLSVSLSFSQLLPACSAWLEQVGDVWQYMKSLLIISSTVAIGLRRSPRFFGVGALVLQWYRFDDAASVVL